jgi:hypothetical protein
VWLRSIYTLPRIGLQPILACALNRTLPVLLACLVALRRLVFLNAGHRWWDARMGLSSPLIRISWSYNAARGTLLRDSPAVIDISTSRQFAQGRRGRGVSKLVLPCATFDSLGGWPPVGGAPSRRTTSPVHAAGVHRQGHVASEPVGARSRQPRQQQAAETRRCKAVERGDARAAKRARTGGAKMALRRGQRISWGVRV